MVFILYRNMIEHCKVAIHVRKRLDRKMTLQKQDMSIEVDIHVIRQHHSAEEAG